MARRIERTKLAVARDELKSRRIAELKRRVSDGSYRVDLSLLADRILSASCQLAFD